MSKKRLMATVLIAAALCVPLSSMAQPPRGHWQHEHEHQRRDGHRDGWLGWLLVGSLVTAAVIASQPRPVYPAPPVVINSEPIPVAPAPIVVAPPVMAPAPVVPPAMWYYCAAAGKYYPYVGTCPTGWTPVPATPPGE